MGDCVKKRKIMKAIIKDLENLRAYRECELKAEIVKYLFLCSLLPDFEQLTEYKNFLTEC